MRQFAPREGRDRLVGQGLGARKAHREGPLLLLAPAACRNPSFRLERLPPFGGQLVEIGMVTAATLGLSVRARMARETPMWVEQHVFTILGGDASVRAIPVATAIGRWWIQWTGMEQKSTNREALMIRSQQRSGPATSTCSRAAGEERAFTPRALCTAAPEAL